VDHSARLSRSVAFIGLALKVHYWGKERTLKLPRRMQPCVASLAMARKSPLYLCGVKILSLSRRKKSRKKHAPTLMLRKKYLLIVLSAIKKLKATASACLLSILAHQINYGAT
jgi:hypothetical protein